MSRDPCRHRERLRHHAGTAESSKHPHEASISLASWRRLISVCSSVRDRCSQLDGHRSTLFPPLHKDGNVRQRSDRDWYAEIVYNDRVPEELGTVPHV